MLAARSAAHWLTCPFNLIGPEALQGTSGPNHLPTEYRQMAAKKSSKISKALAYLKANPSATPYQAAQHAKMTPTSLYARLKKDAARKSLTCPCCGQSLPR